MPLDARRVGHRYEPFRYEVSREKIREYALATGVDDPRSLADEGDIVAPPTFAACFTLLRGGWFEDPELGVHPNLVHGGQEFVFHRALHVGDALSCTTSIASLSGSGRSQVLVVQTDCAEASTGEPVVTGKATLVFFEPG